MIKQFMLHPKTNQDTMCFNFFFHFPLSRTDSLLGMHFSHFYAHPRKPIAKALSTTLIPVHSPIALFLKWFQPQASRSSGSTNSDIFLAQNRLSISN